MQPTTSTTQSPDTFEGKARSIDEAIDMATMKLGKQRSSMVEKRVLFAGGTYQFEWQETWKADRHEAKCEGLPSISLPMKFKFTKLPPAK